MKPTLPRRLLDVVLAVAVLALAALVVMRWQADPRVLAGPAVAVDGDSLVVDGERVRLAGIDAPELDQTCTRDGGSYPCGREARAVLAGLLHSGAVVCTGHARDRYDRLLADCVAGDLALNRVMVEQGWAVAYGDFADAERAARDAGLGLWAGEFEWPRDWRHQQGREADEGVDLWNWLVGLFRG